MIQAELSLLMMDEDSDKKKHFSLDKLMEDSAGKKKKKKKLGKNKKVKDEDDFQVRESPNSSFQSHTCFNPFALRKAKTP